MQGLLSVMMLGMNLILGTAGADAELLQGSFGIYYKIQQFALFAAFGLSNTLISVIAFNYGMRSKKRVRQGILWGIVDSVIVAAVITLLFQCLAGQLAALFSMTDGGSAAVREVCVTSIHIASIGYIFMAFSVAIQGILQAFGQAVKPLLLSFFRLVLFVFPVAYLFTLSQDALSLVWWTFPIAEVLTAVIAAFFLFSAYKKQVVPMDPASEMKETV